MKFDSPALKKERQWWADEFQRRFGVPSPISNEDLAKAAQEVDQAILDQLPAPEECTHVFSEEFEEKMAALLSPNSE